MKKSFIYLLLLLPLNLLYAQDIQIGLRVQPQLGVGSNPWVSDKIAQGINLEAIFNLEFSHRIQLETGIGWAGQSFHTRLIYGQSRGNYIQNTTLLALPLRLRVHTRLASTADFFFNIGYQYAHVLQDQIKNTWIVELNEPPNDIKVLNGKSEHGIEVGLEVEFPLGETNRIGFGLNYQVMRRKGGNEGKTNVFFHFPGFSFRFARRVRTVK